MVHGPEGDPIERGADQHERADVQLAVHRTEERTERDPCPGADLLRASTAPRHVHPFDEVFDVDVAVRVAIFEAVVPPAEPWLGLRGARREDDDERERERDEEEARGTERPDERTEREGHEPAPSKTCAAALLRGEPVEPGNCMFRASVLDTHGAVPGRRSSVRPPPPVLVI